MCALAASLLHCQNSGRFRHRRPQTNGQQPQAYLSAQQTTPGNNKANNGSQELSENPEQTPGKNSQAEGKFEEKNKSYQELDDELEDPELEKYWKMVKFGVPEASVRQKMSREGYDPDLLRQFTRALAKAGNRPQKSDSSSDSTGSELSEE